MEALAHDDAFGSHERSGHGVLRGVAEGLIPNVLIFILLFTSPWADDHIYDWLALGLLYAGPLIVGVVGLWLIVTGAARRRGVGLVLAALITVVSWFVIVWIDAALSMSANVAGP
jgi:hypothetical protein